MSKTELDQFEVHGLSVSELRQLEAEFDKDSIRSLETPGSAAHHELGVLSAVLALTPAVLSAVVAIVCVPRAGKKREVRIVKTDKHGVRNEVVIKESDYKTGTLSAGVIKTLSQFFDVDVAGILTKVAGKKK